jgi:pimeloyl-ACP methyl ester carboxylesterase
MLASFGSYYCGGDVVTVSGTTPRTVQVTSYLRQTFDENGDHAVGHAYVQYFVPERRRSGPPLVLLHGGGLCGTIFEHTPDGRPGWLHQLLGLGHEVHIVDSVERGRAGWSPHVVDLPPLTRTLQDAWTLFRFGAPEGYGTRTAFEGQLFPVSHMAAFGRYFVPRWASQAEAQIRALAAVIRRIGRCVVLCHSQGGETAFGAAELVPDLVAGLIAIEPSGFPQAGSCAMRLPLLLVHGDHLDCNAFWQDARNRWRGVVQQCKAASGRASLMDLNTLRRGSSHMPMHDANSSETIRFILEAWDGLAPA